MLRSANSARGAAGVPSGTASPGADSDVVDVPVRAEGYQV
jgi:hypothetical protein